MSNNAIAGPTSIGVALCPGLHRDSFKGIITVAYTKATNVGAEIQA